MSGTSGSINFPNISGGIPTSTDLGPSIVFIAAYVLIAPLALYRTYQCRKPFSLLFASFRICLFTTIRIVTFIIRAIEAQQAKNGQTTPGTDLFVAEQVLLGIGFIVLCFQVVGLLQSHMARTDIPPPSTHPGSSEASMHRRLNAIAGLMIIALLAAIALGIVAGVDYANAISNPSVASTTKTERIVSSVISLAVTGITLLISGYLLVSSPRHPRLSSAYILVVSCILIIVPAYRLSTLENSTNSVEILTSTTTKVEFWILQALMEWITLALLLAVDTRKWFDAGGMQAKEMMVGRGQSVELGRIPQAPVAAPQ